MLPKYSSNIVDQHDKKIGGVNTLVPNLFNKIKYVLHYRKLQLYLRSEIDSFHGIFKFEQSDWLKRYLCFNTDKRKKADNNKKKFLLKNSQKFKKKSKVYIR